MVMAIAIAGEHHAQASWRGAWCDEIGGGVLKLGPHMNNHARRTTRERMNEVRDLVRDSLSPIADFCRTLFVFRALRIEAR
jgi:hypothetical protein